MGIVIDIRDSVGSVQHLMCYYCNERSYIKLDLLLPIIQHRKVAFNVETPS